MSSYIDAGNLFVVLCAIPSVGSVLAYLRVKWWTSPLGLHLMSYMFAVAFLFCLALARFWFEDSWWFQPLRAFGYGIFVIVLWWRFIYIVKSAFESDRANDSYEGMNK